MFRKIAAALVAATMLMAPVLAVESAAATPPETVKPGKAKTSKAKTTKVETSKVMTGSKAKIANKIAGKTARKPMTLAARTGKKQAATKKPKQQAKVLPAKIEQAKSKAPADYTGSVAPRSVPTPGLY